MWHYVDEQQQAKAIDLEGLTSALQKGDIKADAQVCPPGQTSWLTASQVPLLQLPEETAQATNEDELWHFVNAAQQAEDIKLGGLKEKLSKGELKTNTLVCPPGSANWQMASELPDLLPELTAPRAPAATPAQNPAPTPAPTLDPADDEVWHFVNEEQQAQDIKLGGLKEKFIKGELKNDALVCPPGSPDWQMASEMPQLTALSAQPAVADATAKNEEMWHFVNKKSEPEEIKFGNLKESLLNGDLGQDTLVCPFGATDWAQAADVPELHPSKEQAAADSNVINPEEIWAFVNDEQQAQHIKLGELKSAVQKGKLNMDTMVCSPARQQDGWIKASEMPELKPEYIACPKCEGKEWDGGARQKEYPDGYCDAPNCPNDRAERCLKCEMDLCFDCLTGKGKYPPLKTSSPEKEIPEEEKWFWADWKDNKPKATTLDELRSNLRKGELPPDTLVMSAERDGWKQAQDMPEFQDHVPKIAIPDVKLSELVEVLSIDILRAEGLKKLTPTLMKSEPLADPKVIISHNGKKVGQTQVHKGGHVKPKWDQHIDVQIEDNKKFDINKPLIFKVVDDGLITDTELGQVSFDLKELLGCNGAPLGAYKIENSAKCKDASGKLHLRIYPHMKETAAAAPTEPVEAPPKESITSFAVEVMRGKDLTPRDKTGTLFLAEYTTSDPFVRISCNNQALATSQVIKKTLYPVWDETFILPVPEKFEMKYPLIISLYDQDIVSKEFKEEEMGEVRLDADEMLKNNGLEKWYDVAPTPNCKKATGQIRLRITAQ